jgi:dsRNA-specific ribonuclease
MLDISDILKSFKIQTNNRGLYKQAFTHSSYINEKKSKYGHYERLEFIGDGVLDLVLADLVYKTYPKLDQGELSKLRIYFVNGETLTKYARKYHFDEVLLLRAKIGILENDVNKAKEYLDELIKKYPYDITADDALFMLSDIYLNYLNETALAKDILEKIILDYPNSIYVIEARKHLKGL